MSKKLLILLSFIATYFLGIYSSSLFEHSAIFQSQHSTPNPNSNPSQNKNRNAHELAESDSYQTQSELNRVEEVLGVENAVLDKAQALNLQSPQELQATINKLRGELEKYQQAEAKRKHVNQQRKVNYKQRQEVLERIYGTEVYRTRYARERLEQVKYELQSELGLSDDESTQLNQLLLDKMTKDALARSELSNSEFHTKEERQVAFTELSIKRNQYQAEFENKLREVLDDETINRYREFEISKYKRQVAGILRNQKDNLFGTIPDISDYQIEQVSSYFDSFAINEEGVELGGYGASGQRDYREYWKHLRSSETLEFLRTILSEQQLEAYTKKYHRKDSK